MRDARVLRMLAGALLCFAFGSLPAQPPPLVPTLEIDGLGKTTIPLDGPWQFHLGDSPSFASPQLDDSTWQPILAGQPWEAQGYHGYTGFAWYRRHITIAPGTPANLDLAVYLRAVDSAAELYWNGVLIGSLGKVAPHPVWYMNSPGGVFPLGPIPTPSRSGVLAIRVWKAPILFLSVPAEGGLVSIPRAGSLEAVNALDTATHYKWLKANQFALGVVLLTSIIGLLSLLVWLRRRDRLIFLWLTLTMFFPTEQFLIASVPGVLPFRVAYGAIGVAIAINTVALWFLFIALLGLEENRSLVAWTKKVAVAIVFFNAVDTVLMAFSASLRHPHLLLAIDVGSSIPGTWLEFWGLVVVLAAFRKRLSPDRWMLAIAALLTSLIQALSDVTDLGTRWTHLTLGDHLQAPIFSIAGSALNAPTIANTLLLLAMAYMAWRVSAEQAKRQTALENEFQSAQEIQRVLIPEALPPLPGFAVTSAYRPALQVGGDFFQLIPLPNDAVLLVIGDVSGKGLRAAMAVSMLVGAIRTLAEQSSNPAQILAGLNRRLEGRMQGGFATCLALRIATGGDCTISSAGHLAPFLDSTELDLPPALPLGIDPDATFEELHFTLNPSSCLTLYTDGLLEARNLHGELYGFARVNALIATQPSASQAADAAVAFGQDDDITILTITRDV
jgi:hypothetical protein